MENFTGIGVCVHFVVDVFCQERSASLSRQL